MDLDLKGKTIIITGGSGGIGQGLVMEFAREGCNVVSASRDAATGQKLAQEAKQQGLPGPRQQRVDRLQHLLRLPGDVGAGVLRHLPGQPGDAVIHGHFRHSRTHLVTLDHCQTPAAVALR